MSVVSTGEKQERIRQLLRSLAAAKAATVRVGLFAGMPEASEAVRGILNPAPPPAAESLPSLRLGEELHVLVTSPIPGFLHLFNLGSSGAVRRMRPGPGESPLALEADRPLLASPSPALPWVEKGPVNEFPERVLAILTAEAVSLPPSLLHPSFDDAAYARGFSPPIVDALLAAWPPSRWSWGLGQARIVP